MFIKKLKNNYKVIIFIFISFLFLTSRLNNLINAPIWEDNFSWHYRINYYPWILETNFKGTNEINKDFKYAGQISYHPGVTLMSISGISNRIGKKILVNSDSNYVACGFKDLGCKYFKTEVLISKIPLIFLFSISLFVILYLINNKFNFGTSVIFGSFVLFEPFLYTTSRDLHLDYLQINFIFLSILYLYKSKNTKSTILSGIFLGLAVLTRFPSIFILPGIFLMLKFSENHIKNFVKRVLFLILTASTTFVILYPPMWFYPVATINYIVKNSMISTKSHNDIQTEGDFLINYINGLVTYAQDIFTYMSPYWYLGILLGICALVFYENNYLSKKNLGIFILVFLIYHLLLNFSDKKFFRYTVPLIFGLTTVGSYGLSILHAKINDDLKN